MAYLTVAALSVSAVLNTIGVNTHLDSFNYGYQNLSVTEAAINYLGVKNLRDSAQSAQDLTVWREVATVTGAHFDDYMGRGSPTQDVNDLGYVSSLATYGVLNFLEGGDENDTQPALAAGNSIAWTAAFQQQVYAKGHALGLRVINMSFGAGWTALNNWQGDYDKVGDLSPYADFGNAHTYPGVGQLPDPTIKRLNSDARLAAWSRPVMTTEIGWNENTFAESNIARYVLDAVFDGVKDGDVKMYFYALFDDASGRYGLMNSDGTAKPAGLALHNLTTILADAGMPTGGSLSYSLSGTTAGDHSLVMRRSNGDFVLAVWNETDAAHTVTLSLPAVAHSLTRYDPLIGTGLQDIRTEVATIPIPVSDHPVLIQIVP